MVKKLDLNYFYGQESDQFNFIRIPKPLLYDPMYSEVKLEEALTYSMLLDRMRLSMKNGWYDELGRAYIYCSIETVMEFANCGKNKAVDILKRLDGIGLIEKVLIPGRGLKIYVKNFIPKDAPKFENQTQGEKVVPVDNCKSDDSVTEDADRAVYNSNEVVCKSNHPVYEINHAVCNSNLSGPEIKPEAVYFSNPNKNNINNNNYSDNESNHIKSNQNSADVMGRDEMGYRDFIRRNIALEDLYAKYPEDAKLIDGIYDILVETVLSRRNTIVVSSSEYDANVVKSKLLKLDFEDVSYAIDSYKNNAKNPKNMRQYLLAVLFNAPSTIEAYHQAEYTRSMEEYYDLKKAIQY